MKEQIDEIKVFNDDEISVGKWFYGKPNLTPDKNGNISFSNGNSVNWNLGNNSNYRIVISNSGNENRVSNSLH